jgi:uncharacterized membrane protein YhaH (DUF805 family)
MTDNPSQSLYPGFLAAYFGIIAIVTLALLVLSLVVNWRIASKAGYNGALSLLMLIPGVSVVMLIIFAFSEWPVERAARGQSISQ